MSTELQNGLVKSFLVLAIVSVLAGLSAFPPNVSAAQAPAPAPVGDQTAALPTDQIIVQYRAFSEPTIRQRNS